ncbi:PAS domain-containing protein [Amycolatopsis rhizosphaerae]|uniref:PAS domain-containing protein n=1 Tax=Amycolatopsis rhizosphaerae TaxID=2053003 RepID=A0A558BH94_9PSEU|nr:PAS domain-containing protein [Amycolatopsis rhizosphaerae]TVT35868.1 PAS domain-containing protein [Amycolatopsis rhizosphaerae]
MARNGRRPEDEAVFWRNRTVALFDRMPMPVAFCDAHGTILSANSAMAAEWGVLPGRLEGRSVLDLFHPTTGLHPIAEAVRLRRRSRYPVEVSWTGGSGAERHGEMTVDVVSDTPGAPLHLLLLLRVLDEPAPAPEDARTGVSEREARILALAAGGATTAQIASALGLTVDGVNYHFGRLSRRWGVTGKPALVARAYVAGVLDPGAWPPEPAP